MGSSGVRWSAKSGLCNFLNFALNRLKTRAFHYMKPQGSAMRLCCLRVSKQIIVVLFGEPFANGMDFSHDGIVP